jgi:hypothetical protein
MLRRERERRVFLSHHNKTGAIGPAPLFIRTLAVRRPAVCKQARIGRDKGQDGSLSSAVDASHRVGAYGRSGERIRNLSQHALSRHKLHVWLTHIVHDLPRRGMESIAEVEEGNPCDRVHKDWGHASRLLRLPIEIVVVLLCHIFHACFYHAILY